MMAIIPISFSFATTKILCVKTRNSNLQTRNLNAPSATFSNVVMTRCESKEKETESSASAASPALNRKPDLEIGSPIVVIEAPKMIKTAASVPCLRVNSGLVKPGDVGRIVSRKPKDVWAVRLAIGTYLIDGKYFKLLETDE